jgi:hypothetical protein
MPKLDIKSIEDANQLEYEDTEVIDKREERRKQRNKVKKYRKPDDNIE